MLLAVASRNIYVMGAMGMYVASCGKSEYLCHGRDVRVLSNMDAHSCSQFLTSFIAAQVLRQLQQRVRYPREDAQPDGFGRRARGH